MAENIKKWRQQQPVVVKDLSSQKSSIFINQTVATTSGPRSICCGSPGTRQMVHRLEMNEEPVLVFPLNVDLHIATSCSEIMRRIVERASPSAL